MMGHNPELTPLLSKVNEGPRQRGGGSGGGAQFEDTQYFVSATSFAPPPTDVPDDDGKDRDRGWLGKLAAAAYAARRAVTRDGSGGYSYAPQSTAGGDAAAEDEEYYEDNFNDQSWRCSFGTSEDDGIWMNRRDQAGTIMSFMVWILIAYSGLTVTLLAQTNRLPPIIAMIYCTVCALALASHAKTTFTDPGSVPQSAVPVESTGPRYTTHSMCSQCQTFKPPSSHHCRICNRCISRMDHHCPWMNNCIGAGNMKHFILFLVYTWTGSALALLVFSWNYFLCSDESCTFSLVTVQLVRAMTVICLGTLLFTSSMIMNVTYGIMTGIGTIDRLKKKANDTIHESDDEPIPLTDIFGVSGYHTWPFPVDPVFHDYDRVMGYCTPQRLLREQRRFNDAGSNISLGSKEAFQI